MSTSPRDLPTRLQELSDSIKQTFNLINRLAKITFQPGSSPVDQSESNGVREELSSEIQSRLNQHEEDLELLKLDIEDFSSGTTSTSRRRNSERDRERARTAAQVARLSEDLKQARSQFRKAQISAKRSATLATQRERALLLTSLRSPPRPSSPSSSAPSSPPPPQTSLRPPRSTTSKPATKDDLLVSASSDVTASLRSTHTLLQSSLSRSRFAQETLDTGTAALDELSTRYGSLDELLKASRGLVGTLLRSQKSDTWYLETSFWILIATIVWLVYRRLLYGPLWWLVWLPLRLAVRALWVVAGAVGLVGGKSGGEVALGSSDLTRPPLKVQPSAQGGPPKYNMAEAPRQNVGAGAGGVGAKQGPAGQDRQSGQGESMSEQVGRMAEESRVIEQATQQETEQASEEKDENQEGVPDDGLPRRADGTVLVESDRPRNPKKRMWEEPIEARKYEEAKARDEL
ncbi:MAG: hypothetical protein Q9165_006836 [Trypethelium subeluteriae]